MLALLFPGQGAQTDGDRDEVARLAPDLLWQCTRALGEDPFERAAESTRFAQPALFITSIARYRAAVGIAGSERPHADSSGTVGVSSEGSSSTPASRALAAPAAFAGHSLGELSALVAAGALSVQDGLALVIERGRLMAEAPAGAMVAVRGAADAAQPAAEAHGWVVANDNAPGQVVLSGDATQTTAIIAALKSEGLRSMALPVSGAFHSPLMALAAMQFADALAAVDFQRPTAPVYCCATAAPFEDPRAQLAAALTAPVRWRELLAALAAGGVDAFTDIGPGQVIDGLVRRTLPDATRLPIDIPLIDALSDADGVSSAHLDPKRGAAGEPVPAGRFARPTVVQERSDALA